MKIIHAIGRIPPIFLDCMCTPCFVYPCNCWWSRGLLPVLATMCNATVNLSVHVSVSACTSYSFWNGANSSIAGLCGITKLKFWRFAVIFYNRHFNGILICISLWEQEKYYHALIYHFCIIFEEVTINILYLFSIFFAFVTDWHLLIFWKLISYKLFYLETLTFYALVSILWRTKVLCFYNLNYSVLVSMDLFCT